MARQDFICVTSITNQQALAAGYFTPGTGLVPEEVRNDTQLAISIQPVTQQPAGAPSIYLPDYVNTDTFEIAIGNPNSAPVSGTFAVDVGATAVTGLSATITAAALATALNAALTTEGESQCTVAELSDGVYQISAVSNGAIPTGFFEVTESAELRPASSGYFAEGFLGSATGKYQVLLILRQSPVCYAEPAAELTAADVSASVYLAGSATTNAVYQIEFNVANVYTGNFLLSAVADGVTATCGVANPLMDAVDIARVLGAHPEINFQVANGTPDNIKVTRGVNGWNVEFINDLGLTSAVSITATNIDLVGPTGKSGVIDLNTYGLYDYSATVGGDSWEMTLQIKRTRASGEQGTILLVPITLKADILDVATMVPTPLPSYYTAAQSDARFVKMVSGTSTMQSGSIQTFGAGSTLNLNGSVAGTATGGTLNLSALTLTLPSAFVTLTGTQTLTNKTISGASNTITNVSLTSGVTGTLPIANGGTNGTTSYGARANLDVITKYLASDQTFNLNATFTNLTGLSFTVTNGSVWAIFFQAVAKTAGASGSVVTIAGSSISLVGSSIAEINVPGQVGKYFNQGLVAGTGVSNTDGALMGIIAIVTFGASGTVTFQGRQDSSSATDTFFLAGATQFTAIRLS